MTLLVKPYSTGRCGGPSVETRRPGIGHADAIRVKRPSIDRSRLGLRAGGRFWRLVGAQLPHLWSPGLRLDRADAVTGGVAARNDPARLCARSDHRRSVLRRHDLLDVARDGLVRGSDAL